jgi:pyruvate,water dikinase
MINQVGGKCASLGTLLQAGLPVPNGFAVTTTALVDMLQSASLAEKISALLTSLDTNDTDRLEQTSETIRAFIEQTPMPKDIEADIRVAYQTLCDSVSVKELPVAVRSSATAEDLPGASFAGQQDTFFVGRRD